MGKHMDTTAVRWGRYDTRAVHAMEARDRRGTMREAAALAGAGLATLAAITIGATWNIGGAEADMPAATAEVAPATDRPSMVPALESGEWHTVPAADTVPCEYEDSNGCVWVASARGNGAGESFHADPAGHVTALRDDVAAALLQD
jgi:hypothetical protein